MKRFWLPVFVRRLALVAVLMGLAANRCGAAQPAAVMAPPGLQATYRIESASMLRSNSVEVFTLHFGPVESTNGARCQWLALQATKVNGRRFAVWLFSRSYPSPKLEQTVSDAVHYLLQEGSEPPIEFAHRFTGAPVLPSLGAWEHLWPQPGLQESRDAMAAPRVHWLGHSYALSDTKQGVTFPAPRNARRLALLPDVLVGVPSNSRTRDDQRRYDESDYEMIRLTRDDYREMIRAGMNCFRVDAEQANWLREKPVFFWGVGGADVAFPESLFRSTYLGSTLFLDEPAVHTRDYLIRPRLAKDPAFRSSLTPQVVLREFTNYFHEAVAKGAPWGLVKGLRARPDVALGGMHFPQRNLYSWETMVASATWQLGAEGDAGPRAIVFEPPGRWGARRTLPEMNMAYGCELSPDNPANLAGVIFGFLRGAARATGKDWGVSIYGQVDRADAPWLLTYAYDLGATHFFFWDNYQLACVPYGECLALARHLQAHVRSHPRRDLRRLRQAAEVAVLLPPGYDLGHTHTGRGNLWGLGELNLERQNGHGVRYREVMGNFFLEIERCARLGVAFDLLWDLEGLALEGYREVVRVREDGQVEVRSTGQSSLRKGPRPPPRAAGQPPWLTVVLSGHEGKLPQTVTARARVTEGDAPVYYTAGANRKGEYQNTMVLWELYGPRAEDYRFLPFPGSNVAVSREGKAFVVEAQFTISQPGQYRLRAATTDLAGRSSVVWREWEASNP